MFLPEELELRSAAVSAARDKLVQGRSLSQEDGVRLFRVPALRSRPVDTTRMEIHRIQLNQFITGPHPIVGPRRLRPQTGCRQCDQQCKQRPHHERSIPRGCGPHNINSYHSVT